MKDVMEMIGGAAFLMLVVALGYLYLLATPDQLSGEADAHAQACRDAGVFYSAK